MYPTLFSIGELDFHSYTVAMSIAFLIGALLTVERNYKLEHPYPITPAGGLWVFVFALVGARLYYIIQYGDISRAYEALYIWQGGLVFYGGLFGGILGAMIYLRLVRVPVLPIADIAMPYLGLAHGVARVGCFLNGCCWGSVAEHLPWAVHFPKGSNPYDSQVDLGLIQRGAEHSLAVHPSQLYETTGLFIIFLITRAVYNRPHRLGTVAMLYPMLYGILRFFVEACRGDSYRHGWGLTASQWVAIGLIIFSICGFIVLRFTLWRREEPEAPQEPPTEEPAAS